MALNNKKVEEETNISSSGKSKAEKALEGRRESIVGGYGKARTSLISREGAELGQAIQEANSIIKGLNGQDESQLKQSYDSLNSIYDKIYSARKQNSFATNDIYSDYLNSVSKNIDDVLYNWDSLNNTSQSGYRYSSLKEYDDELAQLKANREANATTANYNKNATNSTEVARNANAYQNLVKPADEYEQKLQSERNRYRLDNILEDTNYYADSKNSDYSKMSGYDASVNDKTYQYINNQIDKEQYNGGYGGASYMPFRQSNIDSSLERYDSMTDEEKSYYNYLYNTQGKKVANEYLNNIKVALDRRVTESNSQKISDIVDDSIWGTLGLNALKTPANLVGGLESGIATGAYALHNFADDVTNTIGLDGAMDRLEYNPYSNSNYLSNFASDVQGTTANKIAEYSPILSEIYSPLSSAVDSLVGGIALGGTGYGLSMGASATQNELREKKEQGIDDTQAIVRAIEAGIIEGLTEKYSIDKLLKPRSITSIQRIVLGTLEQAGVEASEEIASEIANTLVDNATLGANSEMSKLYDSYIEQGYTEAQATDAVWAQFFVNVVKAGAGGAISGGVLGGLFSTAKYTKASKLGKSIDADTLKKSVKDYLPESEVLKDIETIDNNAKKYDAFQKAFAEAEELATNGKTETDRQAGYNAMKAIKDAFKSQPKQVIAKATEEDIKPVEVNKEYLEGLTKAESESFQKNYNGEDIESYKVAFKNAWLQGLQGTGSQKLIDNTNAISSRQALNIYTDASKFKNITLQKTIDEAVKASKLENKESTIDDSIIDYEGTGAEGKVNWKLLNSEQKISVYVAQELSKEFGVNLKLVSSRENKKYRRLNGRYSKADDSILIDVYAETGKGKYKGGIMTTFSHELTHWMKNKSPEMYSAVQEQVVNALYKAGYTNAIENELNRLRTKNANATQEDAIDELVARACEDMLSNSEYAREILTNMPKTEASGFVAKIKSVFDNIVTAINSILGRLDSGSKEARVLASQRDAFKELSAQWDAMLRNSVNVNNKIDVTAIAKNDVAMSEGIEMMGADDVVTNESGDVVMAINEDTNSTLNSEKTWENGGREALRDSLAKRGFSTEEVNNTINYMDTMLIYVKNLAENNPELAKSLETDVTYDATGNKLVLHTLTSNGDYPVNFDLMTICKKRVAYQNVMNHLLESGLFDNVLYDAEAIAKVNSILRKYGFETACNGCFVEARRAYIQGFGTNFVSMWNEAVDKYNITDMFGFAKNEEAITEEQVNEIWNLRQEAKKKKKLNDKGNFKFASKTTPEKIAELMERFPALRKRLTISDVISPEGIKNVRKYSPEMYSLVLMSYGQATPKPTQEFNPYNSDVIKLTTKYINGTTGKNIKGFDKYKKEALAKLTKEYAEKGKTFGSTFVANAKYYEKGHYGDEAYFKMDEENVQNYLAVQSEAMRMYLYDIGGARSQSFSDFIIENVFDKMQLYADLASQKFPLHEYTKEIASIRIFGLTGAKENMSVIHHIDDSLGKEYAGLVKVGDSYEYYADDEEHYNLAVASGTEEQKNNAEFYMRKMIQSIGFKDAVAMMLDKRYSKNIGTIAIGFSDNHILKMLDDPFIRMIIPYHKSGLPPVFANLTGMKTANDYTDVQTEKKLEAFDLDGNKAEIDGTVEKGHFDFNKALRESEFVPQVAVQKYLDWCADYKEHPIYKEEINEKGKKKKKLVGYATLSPKFSGTNGSMDFTKHPNYYKLLEDFNLTDCIAEEPAIQGDVTMTYPAEVGKPNGLDDEEDYRQRLKNAMQFGRRIFTDDEVEKYVSDAKRNVNQIIADELKARQEYRAKTEPNIDKCFKEIDDMLVQHTKDNAGKKAEVPTEYQDSEKNIGYHAGDLGKAERLAIQGADRNTGHFGTGTYFVGDEEDINKGGYGERPHHAVNFDDYNLFRPRNDRVGYLLHDFLKMIDSKINPEWIEFLAERKFIGYSWIKAYDIVEEKYGEDAYSDEAKIYGFTEYAKQLGIDYLSKEEYAKEIRIDVSDDDFDSYYSDYLQEVLEKGTKKLQKEYENFFKLFDALQSEKGFENAINALKKTYKYQTETIPNDKERQDSYATVFMKALGFDGVDVRGTGLDNTTYGSVIYDVKPNTVLYSEKDIEDTYSVTGDAESIKAENEILRSDLEKLVKKMKLQNGIPSDATLEGMGRMLRHKWGGTYSSKQIAESLKELFNDVSSDKPVDFDKFMIKAEVVAKQIADNRTEKVVDDYAKMVLNNIRTTSIKLSEAQVEAMQNIYGADWHKSTFGKFRISKNGTPLSQVYDEWASQHPNLFKADVNEADMIYEMLDAYDDLKKASETIVRYNDAETIRAITQDVYDQIWKAPFTSSNIKNVANEINDLKAKHQKAKETLKEVRDKRDATLQEAKDKYNNIIKNLREERDYKVKEAKLQGDWRMAEYKDNQKRNATIKKITTKSMELKDWLETNSKDKHIPESLKASLSVFLDAIDFTSGNNTKKDARLIQSLERVKNEAERLRKNQTELDATTEDIFGAYIDLPEGLIEQMNVLIDLMKDYASNGSDSLVLNQMTNDELEAIKDTVTVLKTTITKINKRLGSRRKENLMPTIAKSANEMKDLGQMEKGFGDKVKGFLSWTNATPYTAFKRLGEGAMSIFEEVQDGWDKFAMNIKEILDYTKKVYKDNNVKVRELEKEMHSFDLEEGHIELSTSQLMSLYCLNKREQARQHILGGGIVAGKIEGKKGKTGEYENIGVTQAEVDEMISKLTPTQKKVADALQAFMTGRASEWGNEVSMERFGIKQFTEENYFPIKSWNMDNLNDNGVPAEGNDLFRLLNMGFTKALNKKANNPLMLESIFDVFTAHTTDMAKYNSLALPVLDAYRWYSYKEKIETSKDKETGKSKYKVKQVKLEMSKAFGEDANKYFLTFLKDLNGTQEGGREEAFFKKMMSNYKISAVAGNIRVALLQPTAYLRAMAVINPKYLAMGALSVNKIKANIEEAQEHSGIAQWKALGFYDTSVSRSVREMIKNGESKVDKIRDASLIMAEWGDKITWGAIWNSCKLEVNDTTKLKYGSDEYWQAVSDKFREIIYRTQVVDSTMTRTQMMRSKSAIVQMATAFMSEPSISYNMVASEILDWSNDARKNGGYWKTFASHGKRFARVAGAYVVTSAITSVVEGFIDALRKGFDDDDDENVFVDEIISNFWNDLDMIQKIPIAKDIVSAFRGFTPTRMDEQYITSLVTAKNKWAKVFGGDTSQMYQAIYKSLISASQITGIPMSNPVRDIVAFWNDTIGQMYPSMKIE